MWPPSSSSFSSFIVELVVAHSPPHEDPKVDLSFSTRGPAVALSSTTVEPNMPLSSSSKEPNRALSQPSSTGAHLVWNFASKDIRYKSLSIQSLEDYYSSTPISSVLTPPPTTIATLSPPPAPPQAPTSILPGAKWSSPLPRSKLILTAQSLDKELKSLKTKLSLNENFSTRLREELRIHEINIMWKEEKMSGLRSELNSSMLCNRTQSTSVATCSVSTQYKE